MRGFGFHMLSGSLLAVLFAITSLSGGCTGAQCPLGLIGQTALFDGKDLAGWKGLGERENTWAVAAKVAIDPADDKKFVITPGTGILVNGPTGRTCDLVTERQFGDCQLHIEFVVPKGSNSGAYLQGNYEIQILDSYGKPDVTYSDCGAIYPRWIDNKNIEGHAPRVNASKPPGEWQSFDITFRAARFDASGKKIENARFVKVLQNGQVIHENVELNAPTRGSMDTEDVARGPLRLQGDHGPVAYRNIRIRPLD